MLYAMIDVGSNTIRMAIYDIDGDRVEMQMKMRADMFDHLEKLPFSFYKKG